MRPGSSCPSRCRRLGDRLLLVGDDQQAVAGRQHDIVRRNDVLAALADHRHLHAARQVLAEIVERAPGAIVAQRDLAHMEALRLRREFRLHLARHEIDAQDRADHAERIGDRIADRRLAVLHDVERGLQRGGAGHRAGEDAERMADLDAESLAEPERDQQAGNDRNERQQVVFDAGGAGHSLEELPPVQDADSVEEHDQAGQADRPDDLGLRREGADGKPDEQDGPDAERKAAEVDLADQVADADGEKHRKDRLRPDDFAGKIKHGDVSGSEIWSAAGSAGVAARRAKLLEHAIDQDPASAAGYRRACSRAPSPSI